jgi:hypothetical protein
MKRLFLTLGLGVGLSILNSQFSTAFAIGTNQTVSATITITNPPTGMLGEWISIQGNVYTWTNAAPTYGQIQSVSHEFLVTHQRAHWQYQPQRLVEPLVHQFQRRYLSNE